MLKKIKIGTMGMAIMIVLLITMATFNAGAVNANVSDKKTSDLKFCQWRCRNAQLWRFKNAQIKY